MNATVIENAPPGKAPAPFARTNRGALDSLTIRQRTTGEAAARRAAFTRKLRIGLPIIALVLIAAFFLNTRPDVSDDAFLEDFAELEATTQNLSSVRPHFSGVDARGNPYEITAATASQKPESKEIVELDEPRAVTSGGKDQSVVAAKAGVFNTDQKTLLLKDGVTFEHAIGPDNYVLKSPNATVKIDDQTVDAGNGVEGEGPRGSTIKADSMRANNRDGVVVFEGDVRMRLYPKKADTPKEADEAQQEQEQGDENE